MKTKSRPSILFVFAVLLVTSLSYPATAAERVALVIGVDKYDHLPDKAQLEVAVSDAKKMALTLESVDPPFQVSLLADVEQNDAEEEIIAFKKRARGAECALVYFAGHGIEYHGENFLLVRNTDIGVASDSISTMKRRLGNAALSLQALVDELDATGAQVKVVILDACRDNPLEVDAGGGTRSILGGNSGLAQVTPPNGTLISYSADAGQQANDGLFTEVLTQHLQTPGLPLPHVFALTRETVRARSKELENEKKGVFHEPAEYTKLNLAGMQFSFTRGVASVTEKREDSAEMVAMRKQMELMKQTIQELRKAGVEYEGFKTQLAEMEATLEEAGRRSIEGRKAGEVRDFGGIEMAWCPPGVFLMGSPESEEDRGENEKQHRVELTKGFWMAKTECTQSQWEIVMGSNPSEFKGAKRPVETVSWEDCQEWLEKMNAKQLLPEGWKWVLPTEAQWEYGCRAGTESVFAFGDSLNSWQANFDGHYPYGGAAKGAFLEETSETGSYQANDWGLLDMHGNVFEWCSDWYDENYYSDGQRNPQGPSNGSTCVLRGGGWEYDGVYCRSALRFNDAPDERYDFLGFRPVVSSIP